MRELAQASVSAWLPFNAAIYTVVPLRLRLPAAMVVHFFYAVGLALWEVGFFGARHDGHAAPSAGPPPELPEPAPPRAGDPPRGYGADLHHDGTLARRAAAVALAAASARNRTAV